MCQHKPQLKTRNQFRAAFAFEGCLPIEHGPLDLVLGKITAGVQLQPNRVELVVGPVQAQGSFLG